MKKIIISILFLGLISGAAWALMRPKPVAAPAGETNEPLTYTDPEGAFSFAYPKEFAVTGREGNLLAKAEVGKEYVPQTNFGRAWFSVLRSTDPDDIANCAVREMPYPTGTNATSTAEVNGYPFTKFESSEGAAGTIYTTTNYQGLLDGDCWSLAYTVANTHVGNYPPEMGITEFDREKVVNVLEAMVKSFRFLVNSD